MMVLKHLAPWDIDWHGGNEKICPPRTYFGLEELNNFELHQVFLCNFYTKVI